MNPRFYQDYAISMRWEREWLREVGLWRYRVHAVDDRGEVMLGAQSVSGYEGSMRLLGEFLDGELARRGVPLEE